MTTKTEVAEDDTKKPAPKILQLLPCEPGWHVVVILENDIQSEFKHRVAAWALLDTGATVPMIRAEDADCYAMALTTASEALDGDRYRLLTPQESYRYALTREIADGLPMETPDDANGAEAIAVAESRSDDGDISRSVLWRLV